MRSADLVKELRSGGLTQEELANRAGVARETLSRWESGVNQPSLESLAGLARAAGRSIEVRVLPAEPKLVEQVNKQLEMPPTERLRLLLGPGAWSRGRDALRAAAAVSDLTVVVGPIAAALLGAPERPGDGRIDLLVPPEDAQQAFELLLAADAWPDGFEWSGEGGERRERWRVGRGALTLRTEAHGMSDIAALRDRAQPVALSPGRHEIGVVRVPLASDLSRVMEHSPWGQDAVYRAGLRAVLASDCYTSRKREQQARRAA
jgi:transcriptional regulator with XRE-family HTH domain